MFLFFFSLSLSLLFFLYLTPGELRSFVMAGHLGSLNSFHSFRDQEKKDGAAGTPPGHVDAPLQAS